MKIKKTIVCDTIVFYITITFNKTNLISLMNAWNLYLK